MRVFAASASFLVKKLPLPTYSIWLNFVFSPLTNSSDEGFPYCFTIKSRSQRGILGGGNEPTLNLKDGYEVIFTPDEKLHYEFDCFLEDWNSYCDSKGLNKDTKSFSVVTALDFLNEMQ